MKIFQKKISQDVKYALLSGVLLGLSFPPIPLPYLMFGALIPYLFLISKREGLAEINRITYFTFWVFNLITLYWVGSWTKEADPFLMISGAVLLFFNPLLFLIPSTIYYFVKERLGKRTALLFFPLFWVTYEYLYSVTEFRFPWLTLGNGLAYFNTFIQAADIIGVYGISLLVLYFNVILFFVLNTWIREKRYNKFMLSTALLLILLPVVYGSIKQDAKYDNGRKLKVGLIQPDFNPWKKWDAGSLDEQLKVYLQLSQKAVDEGAEFIVWPESALPVYLLSGNYKNTVSKIHLFLDSNKVSLLTGMPDVKFYDSTSAPQDAKKNSLGKYYYTTFNSALVFNPNNKEVQRYGKIKLVPFGEKVPYAEDIPFIGDFIKWNVGISSWNTGKDTVVFNLYLRDTLRTAGLICIESIYPDFTAQFVQRGAEFLTVITNDSWYGESSGPYQHEAISILRAVENRRFVVRAANGGVSCVINPSGEILKESELFRRTYLVGNIVALKDKTFFTQHPLLIPFISVAITILLLMISIFSKLSGKKK